MTHASGGVFSLDDLPAAGQLPSGRLDMPLSSGYGAVEGHLGRGAEFGATRGREIGVWARNIAGTMVPSRGLVTSHSMVPARRPWSRRRDATRPTGGGQATTRFDTPLVLTAYGPVQPVRPRRSRRGAGTCAPRPAPNLGPSRLSARQRGFGMPCTTRRTREHTPIHTDDSPIPTHASRTRAALRVYTSGAPPSFHALFPPL